MTKIDAMRYIHKNFVVFLQQLDRAQVTFHGPGLTCTLRAEPHPVGLHQSQRRGVSHSFHKHKVLKGGKREALLKN